MSSNTLKSNLKHIQQSFEKNLTTILVLTQLCDPCLMINLADIPHLQLNPLLNSACIQLGYTLPQIVLTKSRVNNVDELKVHRLLIGHVDICLVS